MTGIVEQCMRAMAYLAMAFPHARLVAAGHSAGGQLVVRCQVARQTIWDDADGSTEPDRWANTGAAAVAGLDALQPQRRVLPAADPPRQATGRPGSPA